MDIPFIHLSTKQALFEYTSKPVGHSEGAHGKEQCLKVGHVLL